MFTWWTLFQLFIILIIKWKLFLNFLMVCMYYCIIKLLFITMLRIINAWIGMNTNTHIPVNPNTTSLKQIPYFEILSSALPSTRKGECLETAVKVFPYGQKAFFLRKLSSNKSDLHHHTKPNRKFLVKPSCHWKYKRKQVNFDNPFSQPILWTTFCHS